MADLQFENMFKISTMSLRITRSHPCIPKNKLWMFQFLIIIAVVILCFLLLSYSILFHDIKSGKYSEASKNGTMAIVSLLIIFKYFVLLYHQQSFKDLINMVDEDYEAAKVSAEEMDIVLQYAQRGVTVCKFWLVLGFGTSAIFPTKAFTTMGYYYWKGDHNLVPMFELTYPQPLDDYKNIPLWFWLLFLLCFSFATFASSMHVGFEPLVPILMLHTCGQLDLLSRRISKLFAEVNDLNGIEENLKKIILKQHDLYKLVDRVKINFSVLYEYNMKATTFLLPLTAFQLIEDLRDKRINVEFIFFFGASILHFFMPCYYSDLLMETSEKFRHAIYSCGWEKCTNKRIRQIMLFMITRARNPMAISTVFYVINLDTFAEMCRQSYGILNLMNAACE